MAELQRRRTRLGREERAGLILSAAIALIGERGYEAFSLRQLAALCDMTDAGLLHHFGSKEGLLIALLAERDRQDEEAITATLAGVAKGKPNTRETVLQVLHAIVARNAARPELARLYTMLRIEALRPGHPARDFFQRRDAATMQVIADLLAPISDAPEPAARAVVAMMNGLALQWLSESEAFDLVEQWDRIAPGLVG